MMGEGNGEKRMDGDIRGGLFFKQAELYGMGATAAIFIATGFVVIGATLIGAMIVIAIQIFLMSFDSINRTSIGI